MLPAPVRVTNQFAWIRLHVTPSAPCPVMSSRVQQCSADHRCLPIYHSANAIHSGPSGLFCFRYPTPAAPARPIGIPVLFSAAHKPRPALLMNVIAAPKRGIFASFASIRTLTNIFVGSVALMFAMTATATKIIWTFDNATFLDSIPPVLQGGPHRARLLLIPLHRHTVIST